VIGCGTFEWGTSGGLEECSSWSGRVVRGRPLGVVHLRYQRGVGSLIGWSIGAVSLEGWEPGGGFWCVLVGVRGAFAQSLSYVYCEL